MSENKSWFENGNPKLMFVFGFVSGVALLSLLTSGTLLSRGGLTAVAAGNTAAANTVVANTVKPTPTPTAAAPKAALPAVTDADHIRGGKNAKVVLVEYADFQCPYCVRHHPSMEKLMTEYGDKVEWVFRHFPLSFHENAQPAAVASECASEQGKFWEFADAMYSDQADLGEDFYIKTATDLGLNVSTFTSCLSSGKYDDLIDSQEAAGSAAGVSGTPATFINGQLISGAVPYATLKAAVDAELAK